MKKLLKLAFLAIFLPILAIAIPIAIYIVAAFTTVFYAHLNPSPAQEKIELFMKSDKQEIKLVELFPWQWEFMCTTGDYASREAFETALGRNATVGDYLTWYWSGGFIFGEKVDNLIFEHNGRISIYQYDFMRPIRLHKLEIPRNRCVRNKKDIFVVKDAGESGAVYSLTVVEHK